MNLQDRSSELENLQDISSPCESDVQINKVDFRDMFSLGRVASNLKPKDIQPVKFLAQQCTFQGGTIRGVHFESLLFEQCTINGKYDFSL